VRAFQAMTVALLAATTPVVAQQSRTFTLTGTDAAVWVIAGEVRVVEGTGSGVIVEVSPQGRDASQLKFEAGLLGGRATLRVVYPDDQVVYPALGRGSNSEFEIRDDWTWGDHWGRGGRRLRIRGSGSGVEAWTDMVVKVPAGSTVAVHVGAGQADVNTVTANLTVDASSGRITAQKVRGTIKLDTGSGDISLTDAEGPVTLDTGSGSVHVSGISGGNLAIDTGSGDVDGTGIKADALDVDTGSGSVDLQAVATQRLKVDTGSGDVTVALATAAASVDLETGSGDATVTIPDHMGGELELETGSGGFTVDFPIQLVRKDEGKLRARFGDGSTRISVETGSGEIRVRH
jgi:lia operon protein LiaG